MPQDPSPPTPETQAVYYPFPHYRDAWQAAASDGEAFIFLPTMVLVLDAASAADSSIQVGGYYGNDLFLAAASAGDTNVSWQLIPQNTNRVSVVWQAKVLPLATLAEDVYEVRLSDRVGTRAEAFWLAVPRNLAPVDRYQPSGKIHAEFPGDGQKTELRIWGRVADPLQAAVRTNGHGIAEAFVRIDGQDTGLTLSSDGTFDFRARVQPGRNGVHTVELWARDKAHRSPVEVDAEYVSECRTRFLVIRDRYLNGYAYGCCIWATMSRGSGLWRISYTSSCPQPIAHGKPVLDEQGRLILDASASSNATEYAWELVNQNTFETNRLGGEKAGTEALSAGFYDVRLEVLARGRVVVSPSLYGLGELSSCDSFSLLIPPRISVQERSILGAIHTRWVAEQRSNTTVWVCHLSGHVFSEYAATLDASSATGLTAWASVNGRRVELPLDGKGHFVQTLEIGPLVDEKYVITLYAASAGRTDCEVDVLTQEYLSYFRR